jgi:hypothetical protein
MAEQEPKTGNGEGALAGAGGLVDPKKLKDLGKPNPGTNNQSADTPVEPVKVQPRVGSVGQQAGPVDPTKPIEPVKPKVEPVVVDTPLGKKIFGQEDKGGVVLSTFEDVQGFAKALGIEVKDVNDFQSLLKDYDALKTKLNEASISKVKLDNYERTLKSLPTEVTTIVEAAMNNKDYNQVIQAIAQRGLFNFNNPFDAYNEKEMISHYSNKRFTKDEFDEMEEANYQALRDMAKTRYETEQIRYKHSIDEQQRTAALNQQNFNNSVEASLIKLKEIYPGMDVSKIQRVRSIMTAELHSTLFNPDNTYKADAAERIAMQEFGKEVIASQENTIGDLVRKYTAQGASQAVEKILLGSDGRQLQGSAQAPAGNVLETVVKSQTSFLHK